MKFDRNEKTIKMALSFSESDDFENFTKISVVVWYLYVFLSHINDGHGLKNDRSQFKYKHALDEKTAIKTALSFPKSDEFENFTKISVVVWYMCFWL